MHSEPTNTILTVRKSRWTLSALSLVAALSLTGCLGGSTEVIPVSGVYELQTINGANLPFTFSNGVIVTREVFTINVDGSFTDVTTQSTGNVVVDNGAYSNFGGTVNFTDQTAQLIYQGYVSGTSLNTVIGGFSMIFTRTGPAPK
jgi:hypothetical protein